MFIDLTQARLMELLEYKPKEGIFIRRINRGSKLAGSIAGALNVYNYIQVSVDSKIYREARLAWLYMTGKWPSGVVDHIDGDRNNDKWENLRDVSHKINCQNQRRSTLGTTRNGSGWLSQIQSDGIYNYLGTFRTQEQAHAAYVIAKRELHEGCTL